MRASRAQQLAVRERDRAKAVTDFLQKDLLAYLLAQTGAEAQAAWSGPPGPPFGREALPIRRAGQEAPHAHSPAGVNAPS